VTALYALGFIAGVALIVAAFWVVIGCGCAS
jgi:heme/copper-type cytochrome/quinol oxidase subunit 4